MTTFQSASISLTDMAARIEHIYLPRGGAAMFVGPPGLGKTSTALALIRRLQEELADFGACYTNGANNQSVDIMGWPKQNDGPLSTNGVPIILQSVPNERLRGAYPALCPEEFKHPDQSTPVFCRDDWYTAKVKYTDLTPYNTGILCVDDAGKIPDESVMASLAMIAMENRCGQWTLPAGWAKIFFTNDVEDMSGDLEFQAHFNNRIAKYHVYTAIEDVDIVWQAMGVHDAWRWFAASETALVLGSKVPMDRSQFCTARSWIEAWKDCMAYCEHIVGMPNMAAPGQSYTPGEYLPVWTDDEHGSDLAAKAEGFTATVAARCGEAVALKFHDYLLHMNERPLFEHVIADPVNCIMPEHMGVVHATIEMLVKNMKLIHAPTIIRYVRRMNKSMAAVWCYKAANKFSLQIVNTKEFMELVEHCGPAAHSLVYRS